MMNKGLIITCFLFVACWCQAQHEVFSRQYFLNNYLVNPAIGGANDYMDARLSYSRQWTSIANSPESVLFSFNTNLTREKDQVLRYSYIDKKYVVGKGRYYDDRRIKHGVGAKVIHDKVNVFTYTDISLSYACHVPLTTYFTLSAGLGAGFSLASMALGDNEVGDINDPLYHQGKRSEVVPLVEAGVWFYSTGPYIGGSFSCYMKDPYDEDGKNRYNNIYAVAGWQLYFDRFAFVPSVMYRNNGYSGNSIDLNGMLWFKDVVWIGGSLRRLENTSIHAGVLIANMFELNYTYDINKTNWGASHEVGLAVRIWKKDNECRSKWYFR